MPEDDPQALPGPTDGPTDLETDDAEGLDPEEPLDPENPPAGTPVAAAPAPVEHKRVAPAFDNRTLSAEQRAALAARMFEDPIGVLDEYSTYREAQRDNAAAATEFHYRDYERRAPEFFQENAPAIRKAIALLPAEQRGDSSAVGYAILHAIGQDAQANGGDVIAAITRAAKQLEGAKPAAPAKRAPDPPSVRTPSGGSTRPTPGSSNATRRAPTTPASVEARLANSFGKGAARELMLGDD